MTSRQRRAMDGTRSRRRTKEEKRRKGLSGACSSSSVSDKLIALKSLIPTKDGEIVKAEQLFQETANYIVRLKAQVFVLQRLVDLYGSNEDRIDSTAVL